jgi:hypothetical protein
MKFLISALHISERPSFSHNECCERECPHVLINIKCDFTARNMCTYFDALLAAEICAQTLDRHVYLKAKDGHIKTP